MLVSVFVLVVSRYREYVADRDAALVTGDPDALADALATLSEGSQESQYEGPDETVAALCLVGRNDLLERLLATHPRGRAHRTAPDDGFLTRVTRCATPGEALRKGVYDSA